MRVYTLMRPAPAEAELARLAGPAGRADWKAFPSGEIHVRARSVHAESCAIGRTAPPGDDLASTLLLIDTLRRSGARRVTAVVPYFGYARQDRAVKPGESVAGVLMAKLIAASGATRIVALDLHSPRIASASPIPVMNVSPWRAMAARFRSVFRGPCLSVAPDAGARDRAGAFAEALGSPAATAWIEKRRGADGRPKALGLRGRTETETAVVVDDILDSGRTVEEAARLLRKRGVKRLFLCATHPALSAGAVARLQASKFERILFTDSIPLRPEARRLRPIVVPCAPILAGALKRR